MESTETRSGRGPTLPPSDIDVVFAEFAGRLPRTSKLRGVADLQSISRSWKLTPSDPVGYRGMVESWRHERLLLAHCVGDALCLSRGSEHLGDSYDRFIQMSFMKSGQIACQQNGKTQTIKAGSAITLRFDQPFESRASDGCDLIICYVPREFLESRGINTELMGGVVFHDAPVVPVVQSIVEWALDLQRRGDTEQNRFIERSLLELLAAMSAQFTEAFVQADDESVQHRKKALDLVESHFKDPGLTVDSIAQAVGISRRQLYRLFEGRGVSITQLVRDRRLDHVEDLLRHQERMSIKLMAEAAGFSGADQLARAFKARNKISPAQYRQRLRDEN